MFYPLLLSAPIKSYIWGGTRLKEEYGFSTQADTAAEAWVLADRHDGACTVLNGEQAGQPLPDVLEKWGPTAIGERAAAFPYFPLLIKLIDAHDRLSVQVHPDDAYAMEHEGEFGKTEMWYVVDCEPGASLLYGFTHTIDQQEFRRRIEDNTLLEVCQTVPVHRGDVFFIPAGTLHAIGSGILIAEVQQNSNTTYRLSDYGRLGADGKPRPLHIDKGVEVTLTQPPTVPYGAVGDVTAIPGGTKRALASCPLFTAELLTIDGQTESIGVADTFTHLLCLTGEVTLRWDDGELPLKKGSSVLVPAGVSVTLSGRAELLASRV